MTPEQLKGAEQLLNSYEKDYFTGAFSESTIKDDLQTRKASDAYSRMGSGPPTNYLSQKKQFYYNDFDDTEEYLNRIDKMLSGQPKTHPLLLRSAKCRSQITKLREIVRNF